MKPEARSCEAISDWTSRRSSSSPAQALIQKRSALFGLNLEGCVKELADLPVPFGCHKKTNTACDLGQACDRAIS